jgi:hypothetical protein
MDRNWEHLCRLKRLERLLEGPSGHLRRLKYPEHLKDLESRGRPWLFSLLQENLEQLDQEQQPKHHFLNQLDHSRHPVYLLLVQASGPVEVSLQAFLAHV